MKKEILNIKASLGSEYPLDDLRIKWDYTKFHIKIIIIRYSKENAKTRRDNLVNLENELKQVEEQLNSENVGEAGIKRENLKRLIDEEYRYIMEGNIVRSRAVWYELGEKNNKYFLSLEKQNIKRTSIRKLIDKEGKEIEDPTKILTEVRSFYQNLYQKKNNYTIYRRLLGFFENKSLPMLSEWDREICERKLTVKECYDSLKQMENGKAPGNDGLSKEFYICFWDLLGEELVNSLNESFVRGELSISQRQAVIKLIEKTDKDSRYLSSWRPISLLNVDAKICSKALSNRITKVLPAIIHKDQSAFVKGRFIGDAIRLISDVFEYSLENRQNTILFAADFEKAFET